eukprot:scaffold31414_cov183-Amphora_coffeaeformis.AAC.15
MDDPPSSRVDNDDDSVASKISFDTTATAIETTIAFRGTNLATHARPATILAAKWSIAFAESHGVMRQFLPSQAPPTESPPSNWIPTYPGQASFTGLF